jgi:hypothetical protein
MERTSAMRSRLVSPLSDNDVEEELSIAYLHAVCAAARMSAQVAGRSKDNRGVDMDISAYGPFGPNDGYLSTVDIDVQLKATKQKPGLKKKTHFSYFLDSVSQYNILRSREWATPRILAVLFLPSDFGDWLGHSHDELLLRRCAYWVSLADAAPCENESGQTIYLPKAQCLNPQGLLTLCSRLSHRDIPTYELP